MENKKTERWTRWFRWSMAVGVAVAAATVVRAGLAEPIPAGKDVPTHAAWVKQIFDWDLRTVKIYRAHTSDPEKVRDQAAAFLTAEIKYLTLGLGNTGPLSSQANAVLTAGSKDPLVLMHAAEISDRQNKFDEAQPRLEQARTAVDASGYPAEIKLRVYEGCRKHLEKVGRLAEFHPMLKTYVQNAMAWLIEQSPKRENPRFMWSVISSFAHGELDSQKALLDALQAAGGTFDAEPGNADNADNADDASDEEPPSAKAKHAKPPAGKAKDAKAPSAKGPPKGSKIDPWIMNMLAARYYYALGFSYRGTGWAYTVSEDNSRRFTENMQRTTKHLAKAWEINPKVPEAPALMIWVAMYMSPDARLWFNRTVAAELDYDDAYNSMLYALRPRFGGAHSDMYKFGLECLATKRFDTNVPLHLYFALSGIDEELGGKGEVWRRRGVYDKIKEALDGLIADPSHADNICSYAPRRWCMTLAAAIAIYAGKHDDARKLLDKLGTSVVQRVFQKEGLSYPADAAKTFAVTGNVRDDVAHFEDLWEDKDSLDAKGLQNARKFLETATAANRDALAKPYFDLHKTLLGWQEQYQRGDWVDLALDTKLHWTIFGGQWTIENPRSIVARPSDPRNPYTSLEMKTRFHVPLEAEMDVQFLRDGQFLGGKGPPAGFFLNSLPGPGVGGTSDTQRGWICWVNHAQGTAGVWPPRQQQGGDPVCRAKQYHLIVDVWPGHVVYMVNDYVFEYAGDADFRPDGVISLGYAPWYYATGDVRYSNVRVRKLSGGPPPGDLAARIAYYDERIQQHSKEGAAYLCRAMVEGRAKKYDEAAADCRKAAELSPYLNGALARAGLALIDKGDYAAADKELETCVQRQPDNSTALWCLAHLRSTCPEAKYRNAAAALKHAKKACELTQNNDPFALSALGEAYAESGDFTQAVASSQKAIDQVPDQLKVVWSKQLDGYRAKKPFRLTPPAKTQPAQAAQDNK